MTRFAQPLELISPYSPQECRERIAAVTDTGFTAALTGGRPLVGRLDSELLKLRKRRNYRSLVWRNLDATIQPYQSGSLVSGAFSIKLNEIVTGAGAFLILLIFLIRGFTYKPSLYDGLADWRFSNIINVSLILGYIVLWLVSLLLSRSEPNFIKTLLVSTLNAQIITPSPEDTP